MAQQNSKGTELTVIKKKDQDALTELLQQFRDYILAHEARLTVIEQWIISLVEANDESVQEVEEVEKVENADDNSVGLDGINIESTEYPESGQGGEEGLRS